MESQRTTLSRATSWAAVERTKWPIDAMLAMQGPRAAGWDQKRGERLARSCEPMQTGKGERGRMELQSPSTFAIAVLPDGGSAVVVFVDVVVDDDEDDDDEGGGRRRREVGG
jgi:hypothetical protein